MLLLLLGAPIGISLLAGGLLYLELAHRVPVLVAAQRVATGIDAFSYLAIPFFILAGELMNRAGVTDRIFELARTMIGHVRGALGYVNVLASMLFATLSGSAVADAAGLGKMEIAAMERQGYDRDFSAAITAASATIGPVIPPSISMVVYGLTAGVSIGALFLAAYIPGILMGAVLMGMVYYYAHTRQYPVYPRASLREFLRALQNSALALLVPVLIIGGIVSGFFTPTEAGAFGVFYTLVIGLFAYKTLRWRDLPRVFLDAALSAANVLFIIAISALVGWLLTLEQVPQRLAIWVAEHVREPWLFLLSLNALLLFVGMFLAAQPAIVMLTPVLLPVAQQMGVDPIHLGVIMVVNLMIGLLTPPVGLVLYVVSDIAQVPVLHLARILIPFIFALLVALLITTYAPGLVLWLPRELGFAR